MKANVGCNYLKFLNSKGKVGSLPSHQLLWFLASIYLDPGFKPGSPSAASCSDRVTIPLGHRVGCEMLGSRILAKTNSKVFFVFLHVGCAFGTSPQITHISIICKITYILGEIK